MPLCIIIGAGTGVSLAVARRFGREGFQVAAVARHRAKLDSFQYAVREAGAACATYPADAGDERSFRESLRRIQRDFGAPDVVVYNASAGAPGVPTTLSRDTLIHDFDVNVTGAAIAAQECASSMIQAGRGSILITGGGLAFEPMAEIASLSLGKAAIRSLSFSLAGELGPKGIHVATVTICGFVQEGTPFAPDLIAEEYWRLHNQPQQQWEREVVFK